MGMRTDRLQARKCPLVCVFNRNQSRNTHISPENRRSPVYPPRFARRERSRRGPKRAGTGSRLRRNGDPVAPERRCRLAGTAMPLRRNACAIRRGRRSSPLNCDADASRDRNARIDERLRFSPAWRKRQIHYPLENKGRSPDSSLPTAIFRFIDRVENRDNAEWGWGGRVPLLVYIFYILYTVKFPPAVG